MQIISFKGKRPRIHQSAWISPGVTIVGDVEIGPYASLWFGTVVRGDVHSIRIGAGSNVQDNCVVHVTNGVWPTHIGDDVTIGHGVIVHGCTIGDGCLIGMGSTLLDGVVVGRESLVAAGSVIREGFEIPERTLVAGVPAKIRRDLTEEELGRMAKNSRNYREYAEIYRAEAVSD